MVVACVLTPALEEPRVDRVRRHVQPVVDDFLEQVTHQSPHRHVRMQVMLQMPAPEWFYAMKHEAVQQVFQQGP
jgi:hypothetical protein